jgi:hypothetical protein
VAAVVGYTDPECAQPIYDCPDCGEGRSAIQREPGCVVPATQPVLLADAPPPAFIRVALGCINATFPAGAYFTATEDDVTRFVAGELEERDLSDTLGVRTIVADDGARQLHHGFARADGRTCTFFLGGGTPRCLPGTPAQTELGLAYFFAEDTCSSRIALSAKHPDCEATTHARVEGAVHALTALEGTVYERSAVDSRCFPTLETGLSFWTIGPVDDTLPAADLIALGHAAARPAFFAANGSPMEFARRWVDIEGNACYVHPTATHGLRCIPRSISLFSTGLRFSEPTCTQRIVDNPDSASYAIQWDGIDSARAVTEDSVVATVHPLRTYPASDVYMFVGDQCTLLFEPAVLMAYVGLALDLQKFPAIQRRPAN